MSGKYAYSLNGEHYQANFASREEAVAEAIAAAQRAADSPQSVFVGRRVPADPKASGHARAVLAHMAARAREEFGDSASNYLTQLSKPQIEELDAALELTVLGWLSRNDLVPGFFKVEAIGEISVPSLPRSAATGSGLDRRSTDYSDTREVQEIGTVD
jgi:hypothetical protein